MWIGLKLKLTNRERKLVAVLGVLLAAAVLYYVIIKPQLDMVSKLEIKAKQYDIVIKDMRAKASPDNPAYKQYNELYSKTAELISPFYPDIIQEKLILMLEDKINKANIAVSTITFTEPAPTDMKAQQPVQQPQQSDELKALTEQLNNNGSSANKPAPSKADEKTPIINKMTATINFKGGYSQIYSFIKSIEAENRSIACSSLTIDSSEDGMLNGVLILDFYSIPKAISQDGDYLNWDIQNTYGKPNPFGGQQAAPVTPNPASNTKPAIP